MLQFLPNLGSNCQQRASAQIPLCVVTTLNHKEVLFAHLPTRSDWVVQSASCVTQRFWNTSTALINLTCAATDMQFFAPPLPRLTNPEDGIEHQLGEEDQICIWMGYVDSLQYSGNLWELMEGETPQLLRVFIGVIDTIGVIGTEAGFKYTIQCRDRMRYLMDTHVSLAPFDINNDRTLLLTALGGYQDKVLRSQVILKLAQLGVGHVDLGANDNKVLKTLNGMRIDKGKVFDLGEIAAQTQAPNTPAVTYPPPDTYYQDGDRPLAGKTKTQQLDISFHPQFNITTSRLPFTTETVSREYTIEQQVPIELIKFFSNQEAYPTELFCSSQDGNYYYVPRASDISSLSDPRRFYRTYYYRFQPPGLADSSVINDLKAKYPEVSINDQENSLKLDPTLPFQNPVDWAQGIHNWREERTSLNTYTNYIIANNSPNNSKAGSVILMHMVVRPPALSGRAIGGRNYYIIDQDIDNRIEALTLGAAHSRIHSKEMRSATMTVVGDPSLTPGELVQVIGSPLHPELNNLENIVAERYGTVEYLSRERVSFNDILTKIKNADNQSTESEKSIVVNGRNGLSEGNFDLNDLKQPASLGGTNVNPTDRGPMSTIFEAGDNQSTAKIANGEPFDLGKEIKVATKTAPQTAITSQPSSTDTASSGNSPQFNPDQKFIFPAKRKFPITSNYGWRTHPITGKRRFHTGVDFGLPFGEPILAAAGGKVTYAGWLGGYGNTVVIKHNDNLATLYAHCSQLLVSLGNTVSQGEVIARCGSTGGSTGPHLHFEIKLKINGTAKTINPVPALKGDFEQDLATAFTTAKSTSAAAPITKTLPNAPSANAPQIPPTPVSGTSANLPQVTPLPTTTASPSSVSIPPDPTPSNTEVSEFNIQNPPKQSRFVQEPNSIFRIEGVRHDFNAAGKGGYTCEVVLLPVMG